MPNSRSARQRLDASDPQRHRSPSRWESRADEALPPRGRHDDQQMRIVGRKGANWTVPWLAVITRSEAPSATASQSGREKSSREGRPTKPGRWSTKSAHSIWSLATGATTRRRADPTETHCRAGSAMEPSQSAGTPARMDQMQSSRPPGPGRLCLSRPGPGLHHVTPLHPGSHTRGRSPKRDVGRWNHCGRTKARRVPAEFT